MPYVNAPGIVSLDAIWLLDNQNVENTYYYKVTGAIDETVLHNMAQTYLTWAIAHTFLWPTNCQLLKLYLRDLSTQFSFTLDFVPPVEVVGVKATAALPNNVAWALKRQTGLAGRANRGRIYWFGITEGDRADDNHLDSARATNYQTASGALTAAELADNAAQEVVFHKKLGTGTPVVGYVWTDLTLDSQRRRLPDHNRHR